MMDDYSRIAVLESEIEWLKNALGTAYRSGVNDGSAIHEYIPYEVTRELLRVLEHGEIHHPGEEWKRVLPHVHMQHAKKHREEFEVNGREREEESGCYHLAHAIVREMMALAQFMGAVPICFNVPFSPNGESAENNE